MSEEDVIIRCVICDRIFVSVESFFEHQLECGVLTESGSGDGHVSCDDGQDDSQLCNIGTETEEDSNHDGSSDEEDSIVCESERKYSMNESKGTLIMDRGVFDLFLLSLESIVFMLKCIMYDNLFLIILLVMFSVYI